VRARGAEVVRGSSRDGGLDREAFTPQSGHDHARRARRARRDLAGGCASDERYTTGSAVYLVHEIRNVVQYRAENDEQLRIIVRQRFVGRPEPRLTLGGLSDPHCEPAKRRHELPRSTSA
jgi:hypothetical protein